MFVPPFSNSLQNKLFLGFELFYKDMDFIRMIGSILTFIAFWITFLIVFKYLISKDKDIFGWLIRLGMDLIEIKILFSFWNSLIFTFSNGNLNNLYMLWVHIFSYSFMALAAFRYYKMYQSN
jgi:hypothetical protein